MIEALSSLVCYVLVLMWQKTVLTYWLGRVATAILPDLVLSCLSLFALAVAGTSGNYISALSKSRDTRASTDLFRATAAATL